MQNSFAPLLEGKNAFSRKFGSLGNGVDPYISGYSFINFSTIPKSLPQIINATRLETVVADARQISNVLNSSMFSTTLPGKNLNNVDIQALGGITWSAPSSITQDNTFSVRFLEFSGLPIHSIFKGWCRLIRDSRSGTSLLDEANGDLSYLSSNYGSTVYYWTTKPDGVTLEFSCCLVGAYPQRDPTDLFGHDIASNDRVDIDMDFKFLYMWEEKWVEEKCREFALERKTTAFNGRTNSGEINQEYSDNI